MKRKRPGGFGPGVFVAIVLVIGAAVSTFAHHGYATAFDGTKCRDLKGTLAAIK